jgi:hypothetical protein
LSPVEVRGEAGKLVDDVSSSAMLEGKLMGLGVDQDVRFQDFGGGLYVKGHLS